MTSGETRARRAMEAIPRESWQRMIERAPVIVFSRQTEAILTGLPIKAMKMIRPADIEEYHVAYFGNRPEVRQRAREIWARVREPAEE